MRTGINILLSLAIIATLLTIDRMIGPADLVVGGAEVNNYEVKIKIGLLVPLSGEKSDLGQSAKRGFLMAGEGVESMGGSVIYENSMCDRDYTNRAVDSLIKDKVDIVITGLCDELSEDSANKLTKNGVSAISINQDNLSNQAYQLTAYVNDDQAMADYFISGYQNRYGSKPDKMAGLMYDTLTQILIVAAEESHENNSDIIEILRSLRIRTGVSGKILFE